MNRRFFAAGEFFDMDEAEVVVPANPFGDTFYRTRKGALVVWSDGWNTGQILDDSDLGRRLLRQGLEISTLDALTADEKRRLATALALKEV